MTRFARAKGSKASNERREEDATPWHIMRQQLAEQMSCNSQGKVKNSSSTLKSEVLNSQRTDNFKEEVWCDFNESKVKNESKQKKCKMEIKSENLLNKNEPSKLILDNLGKTKAVDKCKSFSNLSKGANKKPACKPDMGICQPSFKNHKSSKLTKSNPAMKSGLNSDESELLQKHKNTDGPIQSEELKYEKPDQSKTKKSKKFKSTKNLVNLDDAELNQEKSNQEYFETTAKIKTLTELDETTLRYKKRPSTTQTEDLLKTKKNCSSNKSCQDQLEKTKNTSNFKSNNSYRNFHNNNSQTIIANGRTIKIVKFEAFWIKKEDAIELRKLKKKLKEQNVPNSKIKIVMKLERRKAEKALAREKTNVCYQCRKFGHHFSDCPEIKDSEMSKSGMCFKCGSLEHTHFQCKVTQTQDFRFAVCFVCNEQGHIARQCTLNPKGQYPKGGSCHLCGEITHLRKDCPKALEEKPVSSFTVEKINNSTQLEDLAIESPNKKKNVVKNKLVKF